MHKIFATVIEHKHQKFNWAYKSDSRTSFHCLSEYRIMLVKIRVTERYQCIIVSLTRVDSFLRECRPKSCEFPIDIMEQVVSLFGLKSYSVFNTIFSQ